MGRVMALDVGTKTIGVAVSDQLRMLAHPLCTLRRQGVRRDCEQLADLCDEQGVDQLVVGLPLELDGTEERPARLARQIGEALSARCSLPLTYIDERYTSVEAERLLIRADVSRRRRKQVIDQAAAVLILESWLAHGDWTQAGTPTGSPGSTG